MPKRATKNKIALPTERKHMSSKLSFSIPPSPATPKPGGNGGRDGEDKSKLFVTEFESPKTLDDADNGNEVIPPIQNTWHPAKRMKNLELPLTAADGSGTIGFVVESLPTARDEGGISYGLNVREKRGRDDGGKVGGETERVLLEKLRHDMNSLPEPRMEDFDDRPVEGFGAALLAGYGWKKGQAIGRNAKNKEDVKVKQYEKRFGRFGLGLGFVPDKSATVASISDESERGYPKDERDSSSVV